MGQKSHCWRPVTDKTWKDICERICCRGWKRNWAGAEAAAISGKLATSTIACGLAK